MAFLMVHGAPATASGKTYGTNVKFDLRGHLEARGSLTAYEYPQSDPPPPPTFACALYRDVKIQRKKGGTWDTVERTNAGANKNFEVNLPDKPGVYRALAPRTKEDDGDVCLKGISPTVRHRHPAGD